jgi:hypothetical protein
MELTHRRAALVSAILFAIVPIAAFTAFVIIITL